MNNFINVKVNDVLYAISETQNNTNTDWPRMIPVENTLGGNITITLYDRMVSFFVVITTIVSLIVWLACIISLILNIKRKNKKRALFSGIGLFVPIIAIYLEFAGSELAHGEEKINFGFVPLIIGLILQIVFIIVPFIFCLPKKDTSKPQNNNQKNSDDDNK